MDLTQTTEALNQLYAFIAVTPNLIILALVALGVMLTNSINLPSKYVVLAMFVVGTAASVALIKPIAVALLHGIIYTALADMVVTRLPALKELVTKLVAKKETK